MKLQLQKAIRKFNFKPKHGIQFLLTSGHITSKKLKYKKENLLIINLILVQPNLLKFYIIVHQFPKKSWESFLERMINSVLKF